MEKIDPYRRGAGVAIKRKLSFFNLDYVPVLVNEKKTLPKWLEYTVTNNIIKFRGVPKESDIGEFKI